ncbi:ABC transporter ATP-binding protein [Chloracidobacterium sp. E]|uniref:ABC transporter ATP-binding protein n=1 Tax=Chloracidobacterium sp. N TaxID=2821540 RepID=A0ABX8AZD4_9BACT|nr:ABC transporter ATP-binding protein [Chloracidobacterium aggregatum]QUV85648.1 ABC transporter ATP-binding protein [Chloracidobacterium sp. 2]QUV90868.1 ABC transporter ATP-binding protein [Chloracidobacterium sp. A]QUV94058.1 ABC transporter ATP-binding protein [Chloracidobacterium sp. N]QUV97254.1 ABC transporter ATP-binding protein [Chloracidobacterium sp. E]QUV87948.1 ABC transporter ATP-binding protein [Chloracidobacterium sp. S]
MTAGNWVIEAEGLRKVFGRKVAVADLSLRVAAGEVFGFLGPNGAGKTTAMKMLLGLVHPTAGRGFVLGHPVGSREARRWVGFLPEHFRFHDWMTGRELLNFHGQLHGLPATARAKRIETLLAQVDLADAADRPVGTYSKGMQQRLGLAQALIHQPKLVFLDEPTSGLDPIGRILVRDLIVRLRSEGVTVFFNSHILGDVEAVCDRVVFLKRGRVVHETALREGLTPELHLRLGEVPPELVRGLAAFGRVLRTAEREVWLQLEQETAVPGIVRWLVERGAAVYGVRVQRPSLESLFLETMGPEERAG